MKGSTLGHNYIGIWTNGDVNAPIDEPVEIIDYGSVLMDCATLENNQIGIKGRDILLQIDALDNCGDCQPMSENHRPNSFIREHGGSMYFDICLVNRAGSYQEQKVPAKGNYWSHIPYNGSLPNFLIREDCEMLFPIDLNLDYDFKLEEHPLDCKPFDVNNPPNYPDDDDCDMFVENTGGSDEVSVHTKHYEGLFKLHQGDILTAREEWESSANVSDTERLNAADKCRTKVDFARTYVPRSTGRPHQLFISQEGNNLVNASTFGLMVSPNPTDGKFTLYTKGGTYSARIFNTFGQLVHTLDFVDNAKVDLSDLAIGMYFIQVSSPKNSEIQTLRLVIK